MANGNAVRSTAGWGVMEEHVVWLTLTFSKTRQSQLKCWRDTGLPVSRDGLPGGGLHREQCSVLFCLYPREYVSLGIPPAPKSLKVSNYYEQKLQCALAGFAFFPFV